MIVARYRVRSDTAVIVAGVLHAAGSTLDAEPAEVAELVAAGDLAAVHRPVIEIKGPTTTA